MLTAAVADRIEDAAQSARERGKARIRPGCPVTADLLEELSIRHEDLAFEGGPEGEIIISAASRGRVPQVLMGIAGQLFNWFVQHGLTWGRANDGAFHPPGWEPKIPDISWVSPEREALAKVNGKLPAYWPIAPDFVVEIVSETDSLADQLEKMAGWVEHGSLLGLVVDPAARTVYVHRPAEPLDRRVRPDEIDCAPEVPDFKIDCALIWQFLDQSGD